MPDFSPRQSALSLVIGCGLAISVAGPVQAAGLLDFLFGSQASQAQQQVQPQVQPGASPGYYRGIAPQRAGASPLRMTVQPRSFERRPAGLKQARSRPRDQKLKLATPIDPKTNPGWYLEDPTLRKGDIIVLKGKVLVYEGGRGPSSPSDFASLQSSKLVSSGERDRIKGMAGLPSVSPVAPTPVAAVETAPTTAEVRVTQAALQSPAGR